MVYWAMIKKLISAGAVFLFFSLGSNAAIIEGDGFANSGLSIASISGSVDEVGLSGATFLTQDVNFVFPAGSFTNTLSPTQPFASIGIGETVGTTVDIDTQVVGPVGGVFSAVTMTANLAVMNRSDTARTVVLDAFSDMAVNASDGFESAQASGFAGFKLAFARSLVGDFSNFILFASDDLFVSSQGGIGPLAFQSLFEDSFVFDLASTETIVFALVSSVTASALSPVPIPAAVWLFSTALIGLSGFGKSKCVLVILRGFTVAWRRRTGLRSAKIIETQGT
jgi:hypothetical protein